MVLVAAHGIFSLHWGMQDLYWWNVGSSSPIRDQTWTPCIGSEEFLHHQGIPTPPFYKWAASSLPGLQAESLVPGPSFLSVKFSLFSQAPYHHYLFLESRPSTHKLGNSHYFGFLSWRYSSPFCNCLDFLVFHLLFWFIVTERDFEGWTNILHSLSKENF